jgi:YbbR domain-containing protein
MAYHPFRHLGLKVVSIALAVLLWLTVAKEPIVERSLRVPLQFQNIPAQLEIIGEPPSGADVRVRGGAGQVSQLEPGEMAAIVDLSAAKPGQRLFHLAPQDVRAPFGIGVEYVQPSTVSLEFERSGERVVPVLPMVEGAPAPGFAVGDVSADPATVEVVGPESHLRHLTEATTETISVEGATGSIRETVNVGLVDPAVRLKQARSTVVTVAIQPVPLERTLRGVRIKPLNLAPSLRAELTPEEVTVDVRGDRTLVGGLEASLLAAFVDLAGLGPGRYNLPVQTDPPQDVDLSRVEPPAIHVRIR